jgi:hypothetical protein
MSKSLAVLSQAALATLSGHAWARPWIYIFTLSGPTCVVERGPVAYGTGFVTFAAGQVGTIVLNCDIDERAIFAFQDTYPATPVFGQMTYRDSTGKNTSAAVSIRVITNRLVASDPVTVMPLVSSNAFADTTLASHLGAQPVTTLGYYGPDSYAQVILRRSLTSQIVEFHSLAFQG